MAGASILVRVENLTSTIRQLEALGVDVEDLKDAMAKIADYAAGIIKAHTPVGPTGRLQGDVRGNRAKSKAVVTAGRTSVPYAGPINYGWPAHNIGAAYFMQSADAEASAFGPRFLQVEISRLISRRGLG